MSSTIKVSLLYLSCFCSLIGLAVPSHFRGGIIQWRPANALEFDGRVRFQISLYEKQNTTKANITDVNTLKGERLKMPRLSSFCKTSKYSFSNEHFYK